MAQAYSWADFVICRAGALTVSELTQVGLGAILIPFPQAIDDHQTHNARLLTNAGAGQVIPQTDLNVERLATLLTEDFNTRDQLLQMTPSCSALAMPVPAEYVVQC